MKKLLWALIAVAIVGLACVVNLPSEEETRYRDFCRRTAEWHLLQAEISDRSAVIKQTSDPAKAREYRSFADWHRLRAGTYQLTADARN